MLDADEESGSTKNDSNLQTIEKKVDIFLESPQRGIIQLQTTSDSQNHSWTDK